MKLITGLVLFLALGCFTCVGQVNKGTILLGGTISYTRNAVSDEDLITNYGSSSDEKTSSLGPQAALFIKNNLAVGLKFNYEHTKIHRWNAYNNSFEDLQDQTLVIGPFARYYQFISPELALFGQASLTYNYDYNRKDYKELSANVAPGLAYFISPKIGLEMNFGGITYTRGVYKQDDLRATNNGIMLQFMNGSQIGASFYLSR